MKAYKGFNRDLTCRGFQYEWISVEENPKKSGTYFVLKDAYWVDAAQFSIISKEWSNCADSIRISHWMPIPELPKGGEK